MGDLKVFDSWYKALIAAGVGLGVAAVAASHNQLLVIAIGMIVTGVGAFKDRPQVGTTIREGFGGFNGVVTGRVHVPTLLGNAIQIIGILMIIYGIVRVVASA